MRKALEIGGIVAAVVLIAFGIGAIVLGAEGRSTVSDSLEREDITGTPDMRPSAIAAEAKKPGSRTSTCRTATSREERIDSGDEARCFAEYMRIHALKATADTPTPRWADMKRNRTRPRANWPKAAGPKGEEFAVKDPETGEPAENGMREVWVTETGLSTALNASYMADKTGLFGIVVGIALLLTGIGFAVLVAAGAIRNADSVFRRQALDHLGNRA